MEKQAGAHSAAKTCEAEAWQSEQSRHFAHDLRSLDTRGDEEPSLIDSEMPRPLHHRMAQALPHGITRQHAVSSCVRRLGLLKVAHSDPAKSLGPNGPGTNKKWP